MGTLWPQSGQIIFDNTGNVAKGAKAYFYDATTTTPRSTYSDAALGNARTHPVVADGNGRWPAVFLQFGSYDNQVTTSAGTELYYYQNIPNPEPLTESSGI